jgi:hypothetical protein
MKIRKVPPGYANWHQGAKFDVAFGMFNTLNAMGDEQKLMLFSGTERAERSNTG